jgi:hypothetical protein
MSSMCDLRLPALCLSFFASLSLLLTGTSARADGDDHSYLRSCMRNEAASAADRDEKIDPAKVALFGSEPEAVSSDEGVTTAAAVAGDSHAFVTLETEMLGHKAAASNSLFSRYFCPKDAKPEEYGPRAGRPAAKRAPRKERPAAVPRVRERKPQAIAARFAYRGGGGTPAEVRAAVPGG